MKPSRSSISLTAANRSFGLDCTLTGLSLAGLPLLQRITSGLAPRPNEELAELFKSAYGVRMDVDRLRLGLSVVADAINSDQLGRAMVAAMRLSLDIRSA